MKKWLDNNKKIIIVIGIVLAVVLFFCTAIGWYKINLIFNGEIAPAKFTDIAQVFISGLGLFGVVIAAFYQVHKHKLDRNAHFADMISQAIAHFNDNDNLGLRWGAVYELRNLASDFPNKRLMIIEMLALNVMEKFRTASRERGANRPGMDLFYAVNLLITLSTKYNFEPCFIQLKCDGLELSGINFEGAELCEANFCGTYLYGANLHEVNLRSANLTEADLRGAKGLTAAQLLEAIVDDTTLLDPDLRAEYDRLKAEQ